MFNKKLLKQRIKDLSDEIDLLRDYQESARKTLWAQIDIIAKLQEHNEKLMWIMEQKEGVTVTCVDKKEAPFYEVKYKGKVINDVLSITRRKL